MISYHLNSDMAPLYLGSTSSMLLLGISLVAVYIAGVSFYRIFLHPLRAYPGPVLWRITSIPRSYYLMTGELAFIVAEFHAKYGTAVRIAPDELIYNDPQAWKDIYSHRTAGAAEFSKHERGYNLSSHIPTSIINSDREEHSLLRRQLSHGFSDKSMREQEPIIGAYVDLLIQRLYENSKGGTAPLNMREWYNWTTFDVIGDLGFGSSFDLLRESAYHPWILLITSTIRENAIFQALNHLGLQPILGLLHSWGLMPKNDEHMALVRAKLKQRMELGVERPDIIEGLIRKQNDLHIGFEKLSVNASLILLAGSETTATLLCGATFLLLTNPDKLAKLTEEVRSAFNSDDEITLTSVGKLTYMLAVLNESLRRYPPAAAELPRKAPKGGATVIGKFVPEDTAVAVWQWPINHNPNWWKDPMTFAPERWLDDPRYKGDRLDAMQPFSVGPRNCIGRNLAYAEMRLILARIVFNFDMRLADDSRRWFDGQRVYIVWEKPMLNVYMTPAAGREKAKAG
ncbi:cytochrome P450 [Durotheca rogersii]|uniref:cytochrome P450 n=1 Tax=Durotheca rogersii TaxID=419775 RepID=UPI00221FB68E|nr:cytochrome P450 [Durotheca rogersii]KAI5867907.1 cytochrome P450 [Durotheca rogersii]